MPEIDATPEQIATVKAILRRHVPDREVWAFGSRARWTAKEYSDLDLAILGDEPLPERVHADLIHAFDDSDLPWKVDVVEWARIKEPFKKIISQSPVPLQLDEGRNPEDCEWSTAPLGDLVQNFDSRRVPLSSRERSKRRGEFRYFGATGVMDHVDDFLFEGLHLLVAEDGSVENADGKPFLQLVDGKFWVNNHAHVLKGSTDEETRYLYYALSTIAIRPFMSGSVQAKLTQGNLNRIPVPYPADPAVRRAIAHILGTLDDKIELNRRMSETLEAMARALFKSWFVDFDPVRAKAEGRDPGLPQPLADLFPDSFEDSELGEIPRGWEERTIGDLLELAYGKALKAGDRRDGEVAVFGSNGQVGWHDERLAQGPGIVVGRKGNPGIVTWAPTDFFVIDTAFYVVPRGTCHSLRFLFHALHAHDLASQGADSAVPGLNRNLAYMSPQVLPSPMVLERFDALTRGLSERAHACSQESRALAALRDTLLPKLISGELRSKNTAKITEGIA